MWKSDDGRDRFAADSIGPFVLLTVNFLFSREDFQTSVCKSQVRSGRKMSGRKIQATTAGLSAIHFSAINFSAGCVPA